MRGGAASGPNRGPSTRTFHRSSLAGRAYSDGLADSQDIYIYRTVSITGLENMSYINTSKVYILPHADYNNLGR